MLTSILALLFQFHHDPAFLLTSLSVILTISVTLSLAYILLKKNLEPTFGYKAVRGPVLAISKQRRIHLSGWSFIYWAVTAIRRKDAPDDGKDDHFSLCF